MVMEFTEGETTGPCDPDASVIRLDRESGDPLAVLLHYTAHALTVGPRTFSYTADYPGVACGVIERAFPGSRALFFNGAAGNVHPRRCMRQDFTAMEEVGTELGGVFVETAGSAVRIAEGDGAGSPGIRFVSRTLDFPNRAEPSLTVRAELSCLSIGSLIVTTVPAEFYVEFQLSLKEQLGAIAPVVLIGYANSHVGYVPTESSYDEGGYGVDLYRSDNPQYSRTAVPPGAGEKITEVLVEMARSLAGGFPRMGSRE
jgi:hypothetical protein